MQTAVDKNLLNADSERIRKAVLKRFSSLDGIGEVLEGCTTYAEALEKSKLGFTPEIRTLRTVANSAPIEGYKALYNKDSLLAIVKSDYTVVSNSEAFSVAEDLVDEEGFTYFTSNIQKDGARCRLVLAGPPVYISDEVFTPYAIFNNSFDLSRSISVQFMFERLVCLNGLMRRAPGLTSSIYLTHFGQKDTKLKRLSEFKSNFEKTLKYLQHEAEAFKSIKVTREDFKKEILPLITSHIFQRPADASLSARQIVRTQAFIEAAMSAYDSTDTQNFDDTAYKVLLTMTDLDSHLAPFVNRSNPDVYINRVLQTETLMSMANVVGNHFIKEYSLNIK